MSDPAGMFAAQGADVAGSAAAAHAGSCAAAASPGAASSRRLFRGAPSSATGHTGWDLRSSADRRLVGTPPPPAQGCPASRCNAKSAAGAAGAPAGCARLAAASPAASTVVMGSAVAACRIASGADLLTLAGTAAAASAAGVAAACASEMDSTGCAASPPATDRSPASSTAAACAAEHASRRIRFSNACKWRIGRRSRTLVNHQVGHNMAQHSRAEKGKRTMLKGSTSNLDPGGKHEVHAAALNRLCHLRSRQQHISWLWHLSYWSILLARQSSTASPKSHLAGRRGPDSLPVNDVGMQPVLTACVRCKPILETVDRPLVSHHAWHDSLVLCLAERLRLLKLIGVASDLGLRPTAGLAWRGNGRPAS